jgi:hypothetical protein
VHGVILELLAEVTEDQWGRFTTGRQSRPVWPGRRLPGWPRTTPPNGSRTGVYRLRGAPPVDHLDLRAAWPQLALDTRSGSAPQDRGGVAPLGRGRAPMFACTGWILPSDEWTTVAGPVTRPACTAADLLGDREDPEAVAQVIADAPRAVHDDPGLWQGRSRCTRIGSGSPTAMSWHCCSGCWISAMVPNATPGCSVDTAGWPTR